MITLKYLKCVFLQAILSLGFGTLGKIFLEYEDKWWWEGCEGIHLVWTEDFPDFEHTTPRERQQQVLRIS